MIAISPKELFSKEAHINCFIRYINEHLLAATPSKYMVVCYSYDTFPICITPDIKEHIVKTYEKAGWSKVKFLDDRTWIQTIEFEA